MPGKERIKIGPGITPPAPSTWMNPLNKIKWRKVMMERRTTHTLDDGRSFILDYKRRPGYVLIKPVKGFAPMGWFSLERIERQDGDWIVKD